MAFFSIHTYVKTKFKAKLQFLSSRVYQMTEKLRWSYIVYNIYFLFLHAYNYCLCRCFLTGRIYFLSNAVSGDLQWFCVVVFQNRMFLSFNLCLSVKVDRLMFIYIDILINQLKFNTTIWIKLIKLWKERLNTGCQNEQCPLTITHWTQIKIIAYDIGNPVSIEGIDILYH